MKVFKNKCAFGCTSEIKPVGKYFREKVLSKIKLRCEICNATELEYNLYLKHISVCKQHSKLNNNNPSTGIKESGWSHRIRISYRI